jgi:hypothetical protein
MSFYSEENVSHVITQAKEFALYLATNSLNATPNPIKQNAKVTAKVFFTFYNNLQTKLANDYSAAVVIGEMRGIERVIKYLEETDVFKNEAERDELYGDMLFVINDLSKRCKKDFNFECNVDQEFIVKRTEEYLARHASPRSDEAYPLNQSHS